MKLAGYIKEFKEVMFTVPIYKDKTKYYFHEVDDKYRITGFFEFEEEDFREKFISLNVNSNFFIGDFGATIFKGEKCNIIINNLKKVKKYLNNSKYDTFLSIKEDLKYFEDLI